MTSISKTVLGVLEDEHLFSSVAGKPIKKLGDNFSLDKINLMPFTTLCLSFLKNENNKVSGNYSINFEPRDKTNIYLKINDTFVKIGIEVDFEWVAENNELHMPILNFVKSELGVSIWNLETYINSPNGIIELKMPVTKYGDTSAIEML